MSTASRNNDREAIRNLLAGWCSAIRQRDTGNYTDVYARDFLAGDGGGRDEWFDSFSGLHDPHYTEPDFAFFDDKLVRVQFAVTDKLMDGSEREVTREMLLVAEEGLWRIRVESDAGNTPSASVRDTLVAVSDPPEGEDGEPTTIRRREPLALQSATDRPIRLQTKTPPETGRPTIKKSRRYRLAHNSGIAAFCVLSLGLLVWAAAEIDPGVDRYLTRKYLEITDQPLWRVEQPEIDTTLNLWVSSVARKDLDLYMSLYSDEFYKDDPTARSKWEANRKQILTRPGPVRVELEEVKLNGGDTEDVVHAEIKQRYQVTDGNYLLRKQLILKRETDRWRISSERTSIAEQAPQPAPQAAQVADRASAPAVEVKATPQPPVAGDLPEPVQVAGNTPAPVAEVKPVPQSPLSGDAAEPMPPAENPAQTTVEAAEQAVEVTVTGSAEQAPADLPVASEPQLGVQTPADLPLASESQLGVQTPPDLSVASEPQLGVQTPPDLSVASEPQLGVQTPPDLPVASEPQLGVQTPADLPLASESQLGVQTPAELPVASEPQLGVQAPPVASEPQLGVRTEAEQPEDDPQRLYAAKSIIALTRTEPDTKQEESAREAAPEQSSLAAEPVAENPIGEDPIEAVIRTAQEWARAWSQGNAEAYLSYYSDHFEPARGQPRRDWEKLRRQRLAKPDWIDVQLSEISARILESGDVEITATQKYRSNTFADVTAKVWLFEKESDRWLIVSEAAQH